MASNRPPDFPVPAFLGYFSNNCYFAEWEDDILESCRICQSYPFWNIFHWTLGFINDARSKLARVTTFWLSEISCCFSITIFFRIIVILAWKAWTTFSNPVAFHYCAHRETYFANFITVFIHRYFRTVCNLLVQLTYHLYFPVSTFHFRSSIFPRNAVLVLQSVCLAATTTTAVVPFSLFSFLWLSPFSLLSRSLWPARDH